MAGLQLSDQIQGPGPLPGTRDPVHIAQRRVDVVVAHQPLQALHR